MRAYSTTAGVPVAALVLALLLAAGCAPHTPSAHDGPAPTIEDRRLVGAKSRAERTDERPEGKTLSASIPARDARGKPVPGLPRHPGSVRVGYSEKKTDGLRTIRAAYLSREWPDAVRGFYRGVFRSEGWQVANVEFSGDGWHFLVLRGDREAGVEVEPRGGGSRTTVELSQPRAAQEAPPSAGGSKR